MQLINNKYVQLDIAFTINPFHWKMDSYKTAWVREDQEHKAHGVKLTIASIGPFRVYYQHMTKESIDEQLWKYTWPGPEWKYNPGTCHWTKK